MLLHLHGIISLYVVVCTYNMYIALTVELAISSPPKQQQLYCVYIPFLYSFRGFVLIQYCNTKGERKPLLSCAFMMKAVQIVVWCDKKIIFECRLLMLCIIQLKFLAFWDLTTFNNRKDPIIYAKGFQGILLSTHVVSHFFASEYRAPLPLFKHFQTEVRDG